LQQQQQQQQQQLSQTSELMTLPGLTLPAGFPPSLSDLPQN
jgi:hypothetical protein